MTEEEAEAWRGHTSIVAEGWTAALVHAQKTKTQLRRPIYLLTRPTTGFR